LNAPSNSNAFLIFFTKKLRLSNPWNYKVPFLITIPYLVFLLSDYKQDVSLSVLASISIIFGVAGFGYLTNDIGDKQKDALIHKENASSKLSVTAIVFLFLLFLFLAIAPWFYLPFDKLSACLLFLQFFLFYIYAFPPLRLKEKGFFGVIADAGYAHINPAVLAAYTFYLYIGKEYSGFYVFLIILVSWQFVLGIRNIVFHQVKDHEKDLESGTNTFVTKKGIQKTTTLITRIVLPLEIVLFIVFCTYVTTYFPFFIIGVFLYWLIIAIQLRKSSRILGYREYAYVYLDDLYIKWVPLFVLVGLVLSSINFAPVFILHFLIFRSEVKTFLLKHINRFIKL
jgi:4-hydroxybenzoate polyprenyltransferase